MKPVSKAPGTFYLENGESCPFCEDENKIPVVINTNLSNAIKKIPINLLRDDSGLIANQFTDLFQNSENEDNALRKIYTNYYNDASHCSLSTINKNHHQMMLPPNVPPSIDIHVPVATSTNDEILNTLKHPQSNVDPSLVSYFMYLKQQTNKTLLFDIDQEFGHNDVETSRRIGLMIQSIIEDYKKKFHIRDQKEHNKKSDCNTLGKKALHICRQKDPFLREINIAIFGASQVSLPKENSDEYHRLAQEYALFRATPSSTTDFGSSKNNYSPAKDANSSNMNNIESKLMDFKRLAFEDPSIISDDDHYAIQIQQQGQQQQQQQQQQQKQQQQSFGTVYPTFDATNFFLAGGSQGYYVNPNTACSTNLHQYQMPASFLAYNNSTQKAKPRTSTKVAPPAQVPIFFSPHQYLMQASQSPTFPSAPNYPQTMMQSQPNFANLQAAAPFYNTSFKETHINTAIIQQHQYQQYNMLAAAAAGNYEMLVYEQMLHQTQKIKTFVARNRLDKRLQSDLAKNASKTNTTTLFPASLPITSFGTPSSATSFGTPSSDRANDSLPAGSSAIRTLFNQIGASGGATRLINGTTSKGIIDPAIISAVDSGSTCMDLDLDSSIFETSSVHQSDDLGDD